MMRRGDSQQSDSQQSDSRRGDALPPLAGVRVVDFGHYLPGPLAGMLLADQGAQVVRIRRPGAAGGGLLAGEVAAEAVFDRGKQVVSLDLKSEAGLNAAWQLVSSADVLIENFRPGVMQRLGLGVEEATGRNPRLVYLSLPGFSSTERDHTSLRAFDGIISAATGMFTDLNRRRRELEAPPVFTPLPVASAYAAVHGALAVTLALYAREQTGRGEVIEAPLAGGSMSALGQLLAQVGDPPARYQTRRRDVNQPLRERARVADAEADEAELQKLLERVELAADPLGEPYRTADDRWVMMWARNNSRHCTQLLQALGIHDQLLAAGMIDHPWLEDASTTNNLRHPGNFAAEWRSTISEKMAAAFVRQPGDFWVAKMREAGVPFSLCRTSQEWLHAAEVAEAALSVVVDDPVHGPVRQFGLQTTLGRTPDESLVPRPARAGDLQALIASWGETGDRAQDAAAAAEATAAAAAAAKAAGDALAPAEAKAAGGAQASAEAIAGGGILAGLKVLDLSTVLAGPCCARTLAEYGADVIKIDAPQPYFGPRIMCWLPMEVSQGKRSMILDIASAAGASIFRELATDADVIVHNFRPGVAERLGIGYQAVASYNPDIVYLNLSAFNGPRPGPWMDLPGFDPVLQAATGIMNRYGGPGQRPELHGFASCVDYLTGYSGALGIALALLQRRRRGGGDLVLTSLAQGAQLVQAPLMWAAASQVPDESAQGQDARGSHSLQHLYRASDGWMYLAGAEADLPRLHRLAELSQVPIEPEAEAQRIAALQQAFSQQTLAFWMQALEAAGLGCQGVDRLEEVRTPGLVEVDRAHLDAWDRGRSIAVIRVIDHPVGSPADNPAPTYARLRHAPLKVGTPTPKLGGDTRDVLRESGHSDREIDDLVAAGIAAEQLHEAYLPA